MADSATESPWLLDGNSNVQSMLLSQGASETWHHDIPSVGYPASGATMGSFPADDLGSDGKSSVRTVSPSRSVSDRWQRDFLSVTHHAVMMGYFMADDALDFLFRDLIDSADRRSKIVSKRRDQINQVLFFSHMLFPHPVVPNWISTAAPALNPTPGMVEELDALLSMWKDDRQGDTHDLSTDFGSSQAEAIGPGARGRSSPSLSRDSEDSSLMPSISPIRASAAAGFVPAASTLPMPVNSPPHETDHDNSLEHIVTERGEEFSPAFSQLFRPSLPDLIDSITLLLTAVTFSEPPIPPGKHRVRWTCRCGTRMHDDFTELQPGGLQRLEALLRAVNNSHSTASGVGSLKALFVGLGECVAAVFRAARQGGTSSSGAGQNTTLPQYQLNNLAASGPSNTAAAPQADPFYVLFCIRTRGGGTRLHQKRLKDVDTDKKAILFLRDEYYSNRSKLSWFTLRHVSQVLVNRFRVDQSSFAQVHAHTTVCSKECVCLPLKSMIGTEYQCSPSPETDPDYVPVFGENYLIHFFRSPSCLTDSQKTIYNQLPKRMTSPLAAGAEETKLGWGVHFQEGWHWRTIYVVVLFFIFTASLVFGIAWSVLKMDIQGAFGVSGFWLTVGSLLLGFIAVKDP
ncbi:hypothetical protein B0T19DRAFT_78731 [Cercophora scortea]|uniref:Uncharacterized protein n=1 Tax=Cercophora scortea TaxID=314031 RepID=A0AAE0J6Q7_9PEZI|nr:hypothetical protein B0T19DRAFT_78731 [Cercophora scortea]